MIKDSDLSWSRFKNLSKLSKREKILGNYTQNFQLKTVYLKSFFEAKTLTGSNFQITDSFILSFWYIIGMINTITGMYFIWRLEYKKLPKKRFKVVRIFIHSSVTSW